MKKNVLVISDNPEIVEAIRSIWDSQELSSFAQATYAFSSANKSPNLLVDMGLRGIDVKNQLSIQELIQKYELIISAHCKQIFPPQLVSSVRCVNIHPGLNPHNRGWYPQVFSILNGKPAGATIHLMDEEVDHGAILYQQNVEVGESETSLDVYRKVIATEIDLLEKHLVDIITKPQIGVAPSEEGNYNSLADFRSICKLDLSHTGTLKSHINLLRALSHGTFRNAYFVGHDGKKIFVRITLEKEDGNE